jgi:hypothetical protein
VTGILALAFLGFTGMDRGINKRLVAPKPAASARAQLAAAREGVREHGGAAGAQGATAPARPDLSPDRAGRTADEPGGPARVLP